MNEIKLIAASQRESTCVLEIVKVDSLSQLKDLVEKFELKVEDFLGKFYIDFEIIESDDKEIIEYCEL